MSIKLLPFHPTILKQLDLMKWASLKVTAEEAIQKWNAEEVRVEMIDVESSPTICDPLQELWNENFL